jgi:hypothetical protein
MRDTTLVTLPRYIDYKVESHHHCEARYGSSFGGRDSRIHRLVKPYSVFTRRSILGETRLTPPHARGYDTSRMTLLTPMRSPHVTPHSLEDSTDSTRLTRLSTHVAK